MPFITREKNENWRD